jgi:hypothetical protein
MPYFCWKCGNELDFVVKVGVKVGRQDTCIHCRADLHVCKNCELWDPNIHNECRETHAPFIRGREESNFCQHFYFVDLPEAPKKDTSSDDAKSKLEDMFKNLK